LCFGQIFYASTKETFLLWQAGGSQPDKCYGLGPVGFPSTLPAVAEPAVSL